MTAFRPSFSVRNTRNTRPGKSIRHNNSWSVDSPQKSERKIYFVNFLLWLVIPSYGRYTGLCRSHSKLRDVPLFFPFPIVSTGPFCLRSAGPSQTRTSRVYFTKRHKSTWNNPLAIRSLPHENQWTSAYKADIVFEQASFKCKPWRALQITKHRFVTCIFRSLSLSLSIVILS